MDEDVATAYFFQENQPSVAKENIKDFAFGVLYAHAEAILGKRCIEDKSTSRTPQFNFLPFRSS